MKTYQIQIEDALFPEIISGSSVATIGKKIILRTFLKFKTLEKLKNR